jgi:hypothetical protein
MPCRKRRQLFVVFSAAHWFKMNAICGSNSSVMSWLRACSHSCSAVFLVFIGAAARERSAARASSLITTFVIMFPAKVLRKEILVFFEAQTLTRRSQPARLILFAGTS